MCGEGQKNRQHASGNQRIDETVSDGHGFNRQQRHDGRGDEECRRHPHSLAAGQQQKLQKDQQRDHEEQDKGAMVKNLRDQNGEDASRHHHGNKGETLLDAEGSARGQELNGKHGRQEGEVPAEHLAEREAHGGGKRDPEGQRMGLAGLPRPVGWRR